MRSCRLLIVACGSLVFVSGCPKNVSSNPPKTTTNSDQSQDYAFSNGVTCHKTADYTKNIKTNAAVEIRAIFKGSGSLESKWDKVKQVTPTFEELRDTLFDICYEYGSGLISKADYEQERKTYDAIRKRLLESSLPKPEEPTFEEKLEKVSFSFGEHGIIFSFDWSYLEKSPRPMISLDGLVPALAYVEDGKPYVDVSIYGGPEHPLLEVRHNKIVHMPPLWDHNSNKSALEIVNGNQVAVFQLIYKRPSLVVIKGIFPFRGTVFLANDGAQTAPTVPASFSLKRIFKYPSWQYPGEFQ